MKKQLNIFGALVLSMAAGMTVSELVSYRLELEVGSESRVQVQASAPAVAAEALLGERAVN